MRVWLRLLLIAIIIFSITSFVWFLLGSTAYFQRGMDLIGTTILWGAGIPVLLLAMFFMLLLIKKWKPTSGGSYVGISVALALSTLLSAALIQSVSSNGWTKEKIYSDTLKMTEDGRYEYRIELVNLFQRNSHARLYVKDMSSKQESYIPIGIQTNKIVVLRVSETNHWVKLEPTDNSFHYNLYTTNEFSLPEEKFEIDIRAGTSSRLE